MSNHNSRSTYNNRGVRTSHYDKILQGDVTTSTRKQPAHDMIEREIPLSSFGEFDEAKKQNSTHSKWHKMRIDSPNER